MIKTLVTRFGQVLRDGVRVWALAPLIPLLVVVPEFAQHIAEIHLGIFESREAARELSSHPTRMAFGYVKIAGLALCILATIRFWGARRNGQQWWRVSSIAWRNTVVAVGLMALTTLPGMVLSHAVGETASDVVETILLIATLPLMILFIHGLSGDRSASLKSVFRSGWFPVLVTAVFLVVTWLPLQYLHNQNHVWAMGGSAPLVWALMIFDSLLVGLLGTMAGTAHHHGAVRLHEPIYGAQDAIPA